MAYYNEILNELCDQIRKDMGVIDVGTYEKFLKNKKPDTEYVPIGSNQACPKDVVDELFSALKQAHYLAVAKHKKTTNKRSIILDSLNGLGVYNEYDSDYKNVQVVTDDLKDYGYTADEIQEIYEENLR